MNRHRIETSSINQWGMTKRRILKKNNVNVGKSTNVWLEERTNVICLCTIYLVYIYIYIYIYTCYICTSTKNSEWTKNLPQVLKFSPLPTPKINPFRIPRIVPVAVAHMKFIGLRWITSQDVWSFFPNRKKRSNREFQDNGVCWHSWKRKRHMSDHTLSDSGSNHVQLLHKLMQALTDSFFKLMIAGLRVELSCFIMFSRFL